MVTICRTPRTKAFERRSASYTQHHTASLVSTKGLAARPTASSAEPCTCETGAKRTLTLINNHSFPVTVHWISETGEGSLVQTVPAASQGTMTVSAKGADKVEIR